MTMAEHRLAGVVLAGGKSSRMGTDKALIEWRGKTLLDHAIRALRDAGAADVFVSGRPGHEKGFADEEPGGGPARAILTAYNHLRVEGWTGMLVTPVDMPGMSGDTLKALMATPGRACAFENMPLPLYLPLTSPSDDTAQATRVRDLHRIWQARTLAPPENPTALMNINTPEDLSVLD